MMLGWKLKVFHGVGGGGEGNMDPENGKGIPCFGTVVCVKGYTWRIERPLIPHVIKDDKVEPWSNINYPLPSPWAKQQFIGVMNHRKRLGFSMNINDTVV